VETDSHILTACCIAIIAALLLVGAVSHGIIRHIVQTSPLWIAIVLSTGRIGSAKWAALPCFVFWLLLMSAIWLFLLVWSRIVTGTYSPIEIAMTVIVGLASMLGILKSLSMRSRLRPWPAAAVVFLVAALQLIAMRVSLLSAMAHR